MKFIRLLYLLLLIAFSSCISQSKVFVPEIGIVQHIENDSLLHAQGFQHLIEATPKLFSPEQLTEAEFQHLLPKLQQLETPLWGSNLFIPGNLKVVGPDVNEQAVLDYVKVVFRRANVAGVKMIIWGSGGSRRIPDGWDHATAKAQFVDMARKVAELARERDIMLALENLNAAEVNFINTLGEALEIVKSVDHPNFRLCADIYHMLKEGESPEVIEQARGWIVYSELAEKQGRTPPGVQQENFRPFLKALKSIGYQGIIALECQWDDITSQGSMAHQYVQKQLEDVWMD